jgi:hypothetical protein
MDYLNEESAGEPSALPKSGESSYQLRREAKVGVQDRRFGKSVVLVDAIAAHSDCA